MNFSQFKRVKVFKNGPNDIFHQFYFVHSWIPWLNVLQLENSNFVHGWKIEYYWNFDKPYMLCWKCYQVEIFLWWHQRGIKKLKLLKKNVKHCFRKAGVSDSTVNLLFPKLKNKGFFKKWRLVFHFKTNFLINRTLNKSNSNFFVGPLEVQDIESQL